MTEEQKEKYANFLSKVSEILGLNRPVDILRLCAVTDEYFRPIEKRIEELEEKISVLLSCKDCPENKDGLICQKEYENKCLAQKIQFIKELQQENAELKAQIEKKMEEIRTDNTETLKNALKRIAELEKEYASLKGLRKYELNVAKLEIEKLEKENAGLKAGRPKWHKVADGDLPSEEGGWVCNQNGLPCYFDWGTEQWLDCEGTQIRTTEWCHMPHKE